jgi:uncharacterized protein YutE (UPF0331/DUF86 family)
VTDPIVVARKLGALVEHVRRLRERRPGELSALRADILLQDAIALSVLVAVQEAVDIALHLAADEGWGVPMSYRQAFEVIAQHGVIDEPLAAEMSRAVSLRNRIAHGYATADVERLWTELPTGIAAFDAFAAAIARHLRRS